MSRACGVVVLAILWAMVGCDRSGGDQTAGQDHAHGHSHPHPHPHAGDGGVTHDDLHAGGESDTCICDRASAANVWCGSCRVGHVAGTRVESKLLFETLDAHGHVVDPDAITCVVCREAHASGGYCEACRVGYVDGQAYMSRLSYTLALGSPTDAEALTCPACRDHAGSHGWCDQCGRGMVGNVAFDGRDAYEDAVGPHQVLLAAIEKTSDCEMCACAMVADGRCARCRISWEGTTARRHEG